jgi:hypothetical protein
MIRRIRGGLAFIIEYSAKKYNKHISEAGILSPYPE